jgi:hypothetical protein
MTDFATSDAESIDSDPAGARGLTALMGLAGARRFLAAGVFAPAAATALRADALKDLVSGRVAFDRVAFDRVAFDRVAFDRVAGVAFAGIAFVADATATGALGAGGLAADSAAAAAFSQAFFAAFLRILKSLRAFLSCDFAARTARFAMAAKSAAFSASASSRCNKLAMA